jgi:hypothetical protein
MCTFGWKFNDEGNAVADNSYNTTKYLILEGFTNNVIKIGKLKMDKSYELLGFHIPFDGPMKEQLNHLWKQLLRLQIAFNKVPFSPEGITLGLQTTIQSTLNSSMAATSLDDKSLHTITNNVYYTILPKMRINRHFPKAISLPQMPLRNGFDEPVQSTRLFPSWHHPTILSSIKYYSQHLYSDAAVTSSHGRYVSIFLGDSMITSICQRTTDTTNYLIPKTNKLVNDNTMDTCVSLSISLSPSLPLSRSPPLPEITKYFHSQGDS